MVERKLGNGVRVLGRSSVLGCSACDFAKSATASRVDVCVGCTPLGSRKDASRQPGLLARSSRTAGGALMRAADADPATAGSVGSATPSGFGGAIRLTSSVALLEPNRACGDTMPGDEVRFAALATEAASAGYRAECDAELGVSEGDGTPLDLNPGELTGFVAVGVTFDAFESGCVADCAVIGGFDSRAFGFAGPALGNAPPGCAPRPNATPIGNGAGVVRKVPDCERARCRAAIVALASFFGAEIAGVRCCDAPLRGAPGAGSEVCKDVFSSSQPSSLAPRPEFPRDSALSLFFG
jgi:hypothetical protein